MFRITRSLFRSVEQAISVDPEMRRFLARHPRLVQFIRRRLTPDEKFGLYLTVGSLLTLFFAYVFFGVVIDLIGRQPLVQADLRVINMLQIFRSPGFSQFMLFVTYLGQWQVVLAGLAALGLLLLVARRKRVLAALLISVGLGEVFVWVVENLLDRPRPPLHSALAPARGFSFPSGHSFIAISFYGLLAYFLFRRVRGTWRKAAVAAGAAALITAIGFSRVYLGVHWPSDVLAGYAAGAAWLTALITALEIRRKFGDHAETGRALLRRPALTALASAFFLSWVFLAVSYYWTHPLQTPAIVSGEDRVIAAADIPDRLFEDLPRTSEGLNGRPIEPINVILVGSLEDVDRAFRAAGWLPMDPLTPRSVWRMLSASILDRPYPQGPGVPAIWDSRPNDLAYEQPTSKRTIRERYHVHIWYTPYVTAAGGRVWFANSHFDQGIMLKTSLILPTHSIDPAVDKVREKIVADLTAAGAVASGFEFRLVEPEMSRNPAGNYYFTDGKAAVIFLSDGAP